MLVTALLIGAVAIIFHWGWLRKYSYWKRMGFQYVEGTFPFGTSRKLTLMSNFQGIAIQELYNKLAPHPYGGIYIWNQPFLLLRDPEMVRTVMIKDFNQFRNRGRTKISNKDPLGQHLFNLDGDLWRAVRIKLTPTFTSGRLKNMFSLFETCSKKMEEELDKIAKEDKSINIKDVTTCFTLDVITSCAFGLESNTAENEEFRKNAQSIFQTFVRTDLKIKAALLVMFPSLKYIFTLSFIEKRVTDFIMALIGNTIKHREANNVRRNDFLDMMIELKNKGCLESEKIDKTESDGSHEKITLEMTPELLAAQCFVFFAAGFETSSSVQSFALYELALNQDVQDKLRKEIDEVTQKHGGAATYQAYQEMHYMEQVISEVIRKYPTINTLTRQCTKTFKIPDSPDLVIEEGVKIIIPVYSLHHDPKYFPDPEKFDPDRFSPERKSSILPCTHMPFGEGPRHCIGMRFGMLQTKMGLYTLLRKYKVLPSKDTKSKLEFVPSPLVTAVKGDIKLLIKHRD